MIWVALLLVFFVVPDFLEGGKLEDGDNTAIPIPVYFDLVTSSGLESNDHTSDILRIAAKVGEKEFFVEKTNDVKADLDSFVQFLQSVNQNRQVVLVSDSKNDKRYQDKVILHHLESLQLLESFGKTVAGFVNARSVLRDYLETGIGNLEIDELASHFKINTDNQAGSDSIQVRVRDLEMVMKEIRIEDSDFNGYVIPISQIGDDDSSGSE